MVPQAPQQEPLYLRIEHLLPPIDLMLLSSLLHRRHVGSIKYLLKKEVRWIGIDSQDGPWLVSLKLILESKTKMGKSLAFRYELSRGQENERGSNCHFWHKC